MIITGSIPTGCKPAGLAFPVDFRPRKGPVFSSRPDQKGRDRAPNGFDCHKWSVARTVAIYAGSGAAIASGDIAHVLYEADFDFRLDGFGNSYTGRLEGIWLLLPDGSAYRHDWSFPFADLNVAVKKAHESARWCHWEVVGEGVTLAAADGSIRDLTDAQELTQPGSDFRDDTHYDYRLIGGAAR